MLQAALEALAVTTTALPDGTWQRPGTPHGGRPSPQPQPQKTPRPSPCTRTASATADRRPARLEKPLRRVPGNPPRPRRPSPRLRPAHRRRPASRPARRGIARTPGCLQTYICAHNGALPRADRGDPRANSSTAAPEPPGLAQASHQPGDPPAHQHRYTGTQHDKEDSRAGVSAHLCGEFLKRYKRASATSGVLRPGRFPFRIVAVRDVTAAIIVTSRIAIL